MRTLRPAIAGALVLAYAAAAAAQDFRVDGAGGSLGPGVAERAVAEVGPDLKACFQEHGAPYVGGRVNVAVRVGTDGKKKRVQIDSGDLGSWEIERCLVEVARHMNLGAARGGEVTVSVPLDFVPTMNVTPLDEARSKAAAAKLKILSRCGSARSTQITFYVGPGGRILSIGFAAPPSDKWAACAAERAKEIVLDDPRGRVMKGTLFP